MPITVSGRFDDPVQISVDGIAFEKPFELRRHILLLEAIAKEVWGEVWPESPRPLRVPCAPGPTEDFGDYERLVFHKSEYSIISGPAFETLGDLAIVGRDRWYFRMSAAGLSALANNGGLNSMEVVALVLRK